MKYVGILAGASPVAEALKSKGLTSQEVDRIMGENARAVLGKIAEARTKNL